jgi:polar amino acid transport system substrate-binding protein
MNNLRQHTGLSFRIALFCGIALFVAACGSAATPSPQPPTAAPVSPTSAPPAGMPVITIVADDWCPYNCAPDSEYPGYAIEAATEIFKKAGYQLKYEYVPWPRAIQGVLDGTYAGAVGAAKGDIPDAIFPEEELGYYGNYLFIRKGDPWRYTGLDSFKNIHLGVIEDYYYSDEINTYLEANKNSSQVDIIYGDDAAQRNIEKLLKNRIDVYLEDRNVVFYAIGQAGLDKEKVEIAGEIGDPVALYIAFSPLNPEAGKWAEILSKGIKALRANGRLAEILQRYGLQDWK